MYKILSTLGGALLLWTLPALAYEQVGKILTIFPDEGTVEMIDGSKYRLSEQMTISARRQSGMDRDALAAGMRVKLEIKDGVVEHIKILSTIKGEHFDH